MAKKKINVQGLQIRIDNVNQNDFISLTDIAKREQNKDSKFLILSWLKNAGTLEFLETWELVHNPDFKVDQMVNFKIEAQKNRSIITTKKLIGRTGMIGMTATSGRYGGTWAHPDVALNFCYWLSPSFQVYFVKEFQRLKAEEFSRHNLEWHISKITDNIDEVRNLLDTIPGQKPGLNRLNFLEESE